MEKVGILGSGIVARTLGKGFLKHGYEVMLGTRDKVKLSDWATGEGKGARIGSFSESAAFGELLVIAIKGAGSQEALNMVEEMDLTGKTIIDTTNPISANPPQNGVLQFFTGTNESLMEKLQQTFQNANFVKAFNSIGSAVMVNPAYEVQPTMFICGNNPQAKSEVGIILEKFGWDVQDMGHAEAARAIEPLCILWCIPGFINNQWNHAFKLLK